MTRTDAKLDFTGCVFGDLSVLKHLGKIKEGHSHYWQCQCRCGAIVNRTSVYLNKHKEKFQSCRSCATRKTMSLSGGEASWRERYSRYKINARNRNLPFCISLEEFKEVCSRKCNYCSDPPALYNRYLEESTQKFRSGVSQETAENNFILTHGIDRINNTVGYLAGNIVSCCTVCNRMKLDLGHQEFLNHIKKISNYYNYNPIITIDFSNIFDQ